MKRTLASREESANVVPVIGFGKEKEVVVAPATMEFVKLNNRWELWIPSHRAARPQWTNPPYWEEERLASMCANVVAGDVVFDIGAEEGEMSALLALWAGLEGDIALFEPNPRVWPNIRAIWEANYLKDPAAWWVGFASDQTCETPPRLNVDQTERDGWPISSYGEVIGDHGFRHLSQEADATPQIRLDDFSKLHDLHPSIITMDVEGSELRVLMGAERVLNEDRPKVWVSVHEEFMDEMYGHTPEMVDTYMESQGYERTFLAKDHEQHVAYVPKEKTLIPA